MRQLSVAIGQSHHSGIQYYFGDKAGLTAEILKSRIASFEQRRVEMLDQAARDGLLDDVPTLIRILYFPLAEAVDEDGRHIYASFLLRYLGWTQFDPKFGALTWPAASQAVTAAKRLEALRPDLQGKRFHDRLYLINGLFLTALVRRDGARASGEICQDEEDFLAELTLVMVAAFNAPSYL